MKWMPIYNLSLRWSSTRREWPTSWPTCYSGCLTRQFHACWWPCRCSALHLKILPKAMPLIQTWEISIKSNCRGNRVTFRRRPPTIDSKSSHVSSCRTLRSWDNSTEPQPMSTGLKCSKSISMDFLGGLPLPKSGNMYFVVLVNSTKW